MRTTSVATGQVVPPEDSGTLTYADPVGNRVVQLLNGRDVTVQIENQPVFIINSALLLELIGRHVVFTQTRRGNRLRAHKKNAPAGQG